MRLKLLAVIAAFYTMFTLWRDTAKSTHSFSSPLISITTTVSKYEKQKFIATLNSLRNQTLESWEWVVLTQSPCPSAIPQNVRCSHDADSITTPFILPLEIGDTLRQTALEQFVQYLEIHSEAQFVTSFSLESSDHRKLKIDVNNQSDAGKLSLYPLPGLHRRKAYRQVTSVTSSDIWSEYATRGLWGGTIRDFLIHIANPSKKASTLDAVGTLQTLPSPPKVKVSPFHVMIPTLLSPATYPPQHSRRIVMILPWLKLGGADRFNLVLARQLVQLGWKVTLVTTVNASDDWQSQFEEVTDDIVKLPSLGPPTYYPYIIGNVISLRKIDVVYISMSFVGYTLTPFIRHQFPNVVIVDYNHNFVDSWRDGGHARFGAALDGLFDLHFVASDWVKTRMMQTLPISPSRISVAYVGVDVDEWFEGKSMRDEWRDYYKIDPNAVVILYPCRLDDGKQPIIFAETIRRLLQSRHQKPIVVVIAGTGPSEKAIRSHLSVLPAVLLKKVKWMGSVNYADMQKMHTISDIMFLPSFFEGLPTTIFEAMAVGSIVVAGGVGGIPELVHNGTNGFIVNYPGEDPLLQRMSWAIQPEDDGFDQVVSSFKRIVQKLVDNPALRKSLSQKSLATIKAYDFAKIAKSLHTQLAKLVDKKEITQFNPSNLYLALEYYRWAMFVDYGGNLQVHV